MSCMKVLGALHKAHRQHQILEAAVASAEGGLLDVRVCDANLVESRAKVDLGEELCSVDAVEHLVHERQRVLVLHRLLVEGAVVDHDTRSAVLLANNERHGSVRRVTDP